MPNNFYANVPIPTLPSRVGVFKFAKTADASYPTLASKLDIVKFAKAE